MVLNRKISSNLRECSEFKRDRHIKCNAKIQTRDKQTHEIMIINTCVHIYDQVQVTKSSVIHVYLNKLNNIRSGTF